MDAFNFIFSLFGLLLGLSLAEVLSGFSRALRRRRLIHLGWLTPLLAIFVMLDLTSFWAAAWAGRSYIDKPYYGYLVAGLMITGLYYLAASLVFPSEFRDQADFDAHYFEHRRQILGAVFASNFIAFTWLQLIYLSQFPVRVIFEVVLYYVLLATAIISGSKRVNIAVLAVLILIYVWAAVTTVIAPVMK